MRGVVRRTHERGWRMVTVLLWHRIGCRNVVSGNRERADAVGQCCVLVSASHLTGWQLVVTVAAEPSVCCEVLGI